MPMCLCTVCDELFDSDDQVEAQYDPAICEGCLIEAEEEDKQLQETWLQLDQDTQAIDEFCEDKP